MRGVQVFLIAIFLIGPVSTLYPQEPSNVHLADPTLLEFNSTYYLYGTLNDPSIKGQGFVVYQSKDLKDWEGSVGATDGFALVKGDAFGTQGFWAPQVILFEGTFYMFYTADEQIAVASSDSPLGPFKSSSKDALRADVKQIDPFVFIDEDGKKYLYHVRLQAGNRIFVAKMEDDFSGILPQTLKECIAAEEPWENTQSVPWPVAEGPTVFKKDGIYYMLYSANDFRNPDYSVGMATAPHPMGPWIKYDGNPILHGEMIGEVGAGHGDVLLLEDNEMLYVFHTHYKQGQVHPRKTAVIEMEVVVRSNGMSVIRIEPNTFQSIVKLDSTFQSSMVSASIRFFRGLILIN